MNSQTFQTPKSQSFAMDLSTQYHQQVYDPSSQVQAYDQSTQAAYDAHHQFNQQLEYSYYTQGYVNAHQQQQSQQEPASIHPPGVPIPPEQTLVQNQQNPYYPQGVADQQQQLNPSYSAATEGMNPAAAAAVTALSQLTQFVAQRAMVGVSQPQWRGNNGGSEPVAMHGGPHAPIGQTPLMGGGGRGGGRPFRGGGPGHFGSRPNGSGPIFHGRGRGRGRGRQFSAAAALVQGESSQTTGEPLQYLMPPPPYASGPRQAPFVVPAPAWPPPRMAWCELCRVDCNTVEILEQHKNGKKHKRNLQVYEELQKLNKLLVGGENHGQASVPEVKQEAPPSQPEKFEGSEDKQTPQESISSQAVTEENKLGSEQQKVSEGESAKQPGMDRFEGRGGGQGFKRKTRGGWGGKWMRTYEGSRRRPIEPPKPKRIPLFCELCNVKCDSQVVFESHLTGKKHLSNLKRFQGHQATLGQAALQALYPALQALFPSNPCATTSFAPQYHGLYVSQGIFQQPVMLPPGQASAGLATMSASAQDPKSEQSRVTAEAQSQDAAIVEDKSQQ